MSFRLYSDSGPSIITDPVGYDSLTPAFKEKFKTCIVSTAETPKHERSTSTRSVSCFIGDMFRYSFWTATVCYLPPQTFFSVLLDVGGQAMFIKQVFWKPEVAKWHTLTHTHKHIHTEVTRRRQLGRFIMVESQSREQRAFGGTKFWTPARDSHWERKSRAVSRSSTSSAAVASILAREKSLMGRPSTTFQVLFCR